jgi:superfamily II DNA or RNA helicase/HKD family nuclease
VGAARANIFEKKDRKLAMQLPPGLYDRLLSRIMEDSLNGLSDPRLFEIAEVDAEEAHDALAQYLEHFLAGSLARYRGSEAVERRQRLTKRLMDVLVEEFGAEQSAGLEIPEPLRRLLAVHAIPSKLQRPDTPLARSALLSGGRSDLTLASQLRKEIATADRVDILCSFIRWAGLRLILDDLQQLVGVPHPDKPRLRVITTSYMGATEPRAVEQLSKLPHTEVRVSYDTKRTRLHAKAYIVHRATGFGCAYVGSANMAHAAMSEGLEWTTKISQYELPYLWSKLTSTFETYWSEAEFERFSADSAPRLCDAIRRERECPERSDSVIAPFDIRPYPFQEEILDVLAAERGIGGKSRHLIVAATGTGKTMIAAFDYKRWRGERERPSLLYIAHREEILRQALAVFRGVLRDQNFGDLLVGGNEADQSDYLFCSIQSYNSRELWRMPAAHFRYIVVDEFHHAAAPSYLKLLEHIEPDVLLGLTATPERCDQLDVFQWFGGEASAEIRLPDAINRRLLCPFQYFGVADCVDLDGLTWERGGYRVSDLDRVYTGNDVRAGLVLEKVRELLLDPCRSRALGFCVSIAHAEFMARFFVEHGVPALSLSANSSDDDRRSAQERLRRRTVNFLFVVDLYNEGVDIPEVDTVMFLRPTESLTVYLQQLGRGLRLHDDKECLTVLDFIGAQRREFRFAPRFRALTTKPMHKVEREAEAGFPHLPAGCSIRLERVAQQRVLENLRATLRIHRPRLVADLRTLGRTLGRAPSIREALEFFDLSLDELLKRGLWSRLLADAGLIEAPTDPDEDRLARGLHRLCHINDPELVRFLKQRLPDSAPLAQLDDADARRLTMLHITLWGGDGLGWSLEDAERKLRQNTAACGDLQAILAYQMAHIRACPVATTSAPYAPLAIHAEYSRDEILGGLGHWTMSQRPDQREGVLHLPGAKLDAFFVTLQKSEHDYSPTTMYEDYAISHDMFHWQSQSTTSAESPTGQRYIAHRELGYNPLLFVRANKLLASGLASPYAFLGPAEYLSHEGSRPISIVWRLLHPMPAWLLRPLARQKAG